MTSNDFDVYLEESTELDVSFEDVMRGATFTPHVDDDGNLSWTNDANLPNPKTVNIMGDVPIIIGTEDLTDGVSTLKSGTFYFRINEG